jgi:hypothetical protein
LLEIGGAGDTLADKRLDGGRVLVEHDAFVPTMRETANDIAAHAPQTDHAELHQVFS